MKNQPLPDKGVVPQGEESPSKTKAPKAPVDWESIERHYRAGLMTVREIARQGGVSHTMVGKRAKESGWTRDLTARVREAVATGLVATSVANPAEERRTEREIVEQAATTVIQLVREHRKEIRSLRAMGATLLDQLVDAAGNREEMEALIHADTAGADEEPSGAQRAEQSRRNAMLKAVALPAHAGVLKALSDVMKAVVPLERAAFSVDEPPPSKDSETVVVPNYDVLAAKLAKHVKPEGATA